MFLPVISPPFYQTLLTPPLRPNFRCGYASLLLFISISRDVISFIDLRRWKYSIFLLGLGYVTFSRAFICPVCFEFVKYTAAEGLGGERKNLCASWGVKIGFWGKKLLWCFVYWIRKTTPVQCEFKKPLFWRNRLLTTSLLHQLPALSYLFRFCFITVKGFLNDMKDVWQFSKGKQDEINFDIPAVNNLKQKTSGR